MTTKFTMKGLKDAEKLSPNFRKTFEEFIPLWLESLLPHYEEAKKTGVDYLYLANILPVSAPCTLYEKNGIGYHLCFDGHILGSFEGVHNSCYSFTAEKTHEVIIKRKEESACTGVALTACTASELIIDSS